MNKKQWEETCHRYAEEAAEYKQESKYLLSEKNWYIKQCEQQEAQIDALLKEARELKRQIKRLKEGQA